jgi:Big-like domain-containing protein/autotransporter-like protein/IPT/TIG domain-containing protein
MTAAGEFLVGPVRRHILRVWAAVAAIVFACATPLAFSPAFAQSPPSISSNFNPAGTQPNGPSTLSFTLSNPNASTTLTGVAFTDNFPANLIVTATNGNTCGGILSATTGSSSVSLAGGTIAPGSFCTITVNVSTPFTGTYTNTTGAVSSDQATGGTAMATLSVANPPTISNLFLPNTITATGTTLLSFTLTNPNSNSTPPNADVDLTGVSFTDTLPAGVVLAPNPVFSDNCGGTLTAAAGASSFSLVGGNIPRQANENGGACFISLMVTAKNAGTFNNTTGTISSTQSGPGATSNTASLTATGVSPPTITDSFGAASIAVGASTTLSFVISNPSANSASLTGVGFTDTLPAGLVVSASNGLTNSCGGTVMATPGSSSISLSGGVVQPIPQPGLAKVAPRSAGTGLAGAAVPLGGRSIGVADSTMDSPGTCSLSVNVTGTSAGVKNNTTGPITSDATGPAATSNTATITVTQVTPAVTSISPNSGPTVGGTSVTITGTNFAGATAVKFGSAAATSFSVNSATSITATSPPGTGIVDVTVTAAGVTSATSPADQFTFSLPLPTVTSVSPNAGPPGTIVTVTGTNFIGTTALKFGTTAAASFTVNSATSITATSPAGTGTVDVTVTTPGGTSATGSADQFSFMVATTTAIASSLNPSSFGQAVTFSAKVTGSSPTGAVTFLDGGAVIGTVTLGGGTAAFTTSSLAIGSHSISAKYAGDGNNASSASAVLVQTVNIPAASVRLHEMELLTMPMAAQIFGQAVTGAANAAIAAGFIGNPQPLTASSSGFTYYFTADPEAQAVNNPSKDDGVKRFVASPDGTGNRFDRDFDALAYAGPTKAPPKPPAPPRDWLAWIDVRATQFDRSPSANTTDLSGGQLDAIAGITRRLTPDFLVGVLGGYEHFDFTSQALGSRLKGDAWSSGAYFGWRVTEHIRFDTTATWSDVAAGGSADAATGNFTGQRWLLASGLTGTYGWQSLEFQPSARVYALWEHDNAFVDSLGTAQGSNEFSTGRASGGLKVSYPWAWLPTVNLSPYAGIYGDYYFSRENSDTVGLTTVPLLQGWSARVTGGLSIAFKSGASVNVGAELGGLGSDTQIWTFIARGNVPF